MARVTKKNGMITNITWKEGTVTTKFLEKYYPSIGIQIISINDLGTVTSKGEFTRFTKKQLKRYYEKSGLKDIEFFDIGSVWMAIRGVK